MAGFYPDLPGPKMMYDLNGTAAYWAQESAGLGGPINPVSNASLQAMINESEDTFPAPIGSNWAFIMLFPVPMDIVAYHYASRSGWSISGYGPGSIERSDDTTNGIDGTWTNVTSSVQGNTNSLVSPSYRTGIANLSVPNVKAIRFRNFAQYQHIRALHLYGVPTSATNDILEFWHPTLDQRLGAADLDFGDVPQGNVSARTFRIKNASASLTANSITVSDAAMTDFSPSVPPQYEYSNDGGATYLQSLSIGDLAPGAISSTITVRKTTPSNAALGLHALRLTAQATAWS